MKKKKKKLKKWKKRAIKKLKRGTSLVVRGPVVKNLPCNAGDTCSIPGQGNKLPHALEQLSPHAVTPEPTHHS